MFTSRVEVLISRPLDQVFAFVSDVRNPPQWDDSVDSEELTSPEPNLVGTTVRTRLRSMGRKYQYTWKIVEHEPPNRMKVESTSGPFPTTLSFQFDGQDGGTRSRPRSPAVRPGSCGSSNRSSLAPVSRTWTAAMGA
jgi:uncharacterized membrane protein